VKAGFFTTESAESAETDEEGRGYGLVVPRSFLRKNGAHFGVE
jgi:hypothetical protein